MSCSFVQPELQDLQVMFQMNKKERVTKKKGNEKAWRRGVDLTFQLQYKSMNTARAARVTTTSKISKIAS